MTTLPTIPWHSVIYLTFLLSLIGYAIYSVILFYHLQNYSLDAKVSLLTYIFYFSITLPLIAIMMGTLLYI